MDRDSNCRSSVNFELLKQDIIEELTIHISAVSFTRSFDISNRPRIFVLQLNHLWSNLETSPPQSIGGDRERGTERQLDQFKWIKNELKRFR